MSEVSPAGMLRKPQVLYMVCLPVFLACMLMVSGAHAQEEDIRARIAEIKQEIETMQSDNDRLRTEISEREEQIKELRQKIEQLDEQLQATELSSGS
ncbi:MAG: hypothetical protein WD750_02820 [Gammaproteobacteria bacterium]